MTPQLTNRAPPLVMYFLRFNWLVVELLVSDWLPTTDHSFAAHCSIVPLLGDEIVPQIT